MFSRPGRGESEEDLLRFQNEFLAQRAEPSASVHRAISSQSTSSSNYSQNISDQSTLTTAGTFPDAAREKRPHERDVVQLQGNEYVEIVSKPPRKKSKFKERHLHSTKQIEESIEEDAADLMDRHDTHVSVLLSHIKERDTENCPIVMPNMTPKGFPTVLHRNTVQLSSAGEQTRESKAQPSLFARQFARSEEIDFGIVSNNITVARSEDKDIGEDMLEDDATFSMSYLITGEGLQRNRMDSDDNVAEELQRIHKENVEKLSSMSDKEIMEEQTRLKQIIDPSILKFLQEKRNMQMTAKDGQSDPTSCEDDEGIDSRIVDDLTSGEVEGKSGDEFQNEESINHDVAEKILGTNISEKWLHMDQVEPEKLEWMKNYQAPCAKKSETSEQARFDFEGNILTGAKNMPEFFGLHHHGEEPERAGYSLEELFLLSRSNFLQQRVLAINVLAKIVEKDRLGVFHGHLEQGLFPALLEAGLPFLLRWSLDDNTDSLVAASIHCFASMLCLQCDESATDRLCFGWYRGNELPSLCPVAEDLKENDEEPSDLPDVDAVRQDLIKGLLQMRLVPRLRYILEVCRPSASVVFDILDILTRIARHSTEAAYRLVRCPRLLETLLVQFVPCSWKLREKSVAVTDVYGHPLAKALKLFRVLCSSGKYLADTLITKFGLITKILRFITVPADQMQLEVFEALELASESFQIWSTCISYGLACDVFSDVYSHVLSQVQSLSSLAIQDKSSISKHKVTSGIALVTLTEAITHVAGSKAELQAQLTTTLANDKTLDGIDASHLPPSPVDWSHVTGLLPVIGHCVRLLKEQFLGASDTMAREESFLLLSSTFNLLASFYQKLVKQPSYSPIECLDEIENFLVDDICVPIMTSKTMKTLLSKIRDYSSYYEKEQAVPSQARVASLPDYGCAMCEDCATMHENRFPRSIRRGTPFAFLLSFARLSMVITSCHKGVTQKFSTFVMNEDIIQYLKSNLTPAKNNCESQCFFVKTEQHFQYFLIKLFYNIFLHHGSFDGQLTALYHTTSLLLFSRLFPGDEYYAHDLMSTVIFNSAFFCECQDESATTITSDMSEMGIETASDVDHDSLKKKTSFTRGELLCEAHKDLLSIRSTFMSSFAQMRHALAKSRARSLHQPQNITTFLLPNVDGTMLPADWMFLPLVELHNSAMKSELTSQPSDRTLNGSCSVVKRTLQWVLLLEEWRPIVLHRVSKTARIARLMCTFLTGSDLFLDNMVHHYLKALFYSYTHTSQLASLDFNMPIPGLTSFYDLFLSFLIQYEAVSFGDTLFSSFLLLPLQQRYNELFRKAVWSEHTSLFRSFSLSFDDLPVPIEYYLVPVESNFEIVTLQLRALATGTLRQTWSPVFYLIAVHHISCFVFHKPDGQEQESKFFSQKLKLMNHVLMVTDETVQNDIICYCKPSRDSPKGFQVFSTLPPTRELLLRYKDQPEKAWEVWNQSL